MNLWYSSILYLLIGVASGNLTRNDQSSSEDSEIVTAPEADDSFEDGLNSDEVNKEFKEFDESSSEEIHDNEADGRSVASTDRTATNQESKTEEVNTPNVAEPVSSGEIQEKSAANDQIVEAEQDNDQRKSDLEIEQANEAEKAMEKPVENDLAAPVQEESEEVVDDEPEVEDRSLEDANKVETKTQEPIQSDDVASSQEENQERADEESQMLEDEVQGGGVSTEKNISDPGAEEIKEELSAAENDEKATSEEVEEECELEDRSREERADEEPEVDDRSSEEVNDVESTTQVPIQKEVVAPTQDEGEKIVKDEPEIFNVEPEGGGVATDENISKSGTEESTEDLSADNYDETETSEEVEEQDELEDKSGEAEEDPKENEEEEQASSEEDGSETFESVPQTKDEIVTTAESETIRDDEEIAGKDNDNAESENVDGTKEIDDREGITEEPNTENVEATDGKENDDHAESADEITSDNIEAPSDGSVKVDEVTEPPVVNVQEKIVEQANIAPAEQSTANETDKEEGAAESDSTTNQGNVVESAPVKIAQPKMTHVEIRAAIIAEAERAFKNEILKNDKTDEAEKLRSEPKLEELEEKEIKKLMTNALGQREEKALETAEKAEEESLIRSINKRSSKITRWRRAVEKHSHDPTEQAADVIPVELPTEIKDETGKNETLPVAIERDAPRSETQRQDMADEKYTDGLGWMHYPWKQFPILKKKFHYDKQCGCQVMWIKRVYTRPQPKSKTLLVHSSFIKPRRHCTKRCHVHSSRVVHRVLTERKPCDRTATGATNRRRQHKLD